MQVRVGPAERYLQDLVQQVQRQVRAQVQPSPDRWLRVVEVDPDPVDGDVTPPGVTQIGPRRRNRHKLQVRVLAHRIPKSAEFTSTTIDRSPCHAGATRGQPEYAPAMAYAAHESDSAAT